MCSVSFVPLEDGFILTSNRDEKIGRLTYEPQLYFENNALLLYPKDANAGGTWIVAKENNTCIVLLNGAFENHQKKAQYRKSRGLILKEIITAEDPFFHFSKMNLKDIEPFTLIIFFKATLTDVKWDGVRKHILPKSTTQPHFWSSATLYNQEASGLRSFTLQNPPSQLLLFYGFTKTRIQKTQNSDWL